MLGEVTLGRCPQWGCSWSSLWTTRNPGSWALRAACRSAYPTTQRHSYSDRILGLRAAPAPASVVGLLASATGLRVQTCPIRCRVMAPLW